MAGTANRIVAGYDGFTGQSGGAGLGRVGARARGLVLTSAEMVVLGSRGHGGLAGLLLGPVSSQVAALGHGIVVMVRGHWRPVPGYAAAPVVVGADGSGASQPAIAVAFAEAALRDVPLLGLCLG
jgi:Universal stress protein family